MGGLNHLHEAYGVPVLMHPDEVPLARGERREQAGPLDVLVRSWRPSVAAWSARIMRAGALRHPKVAHAEAWAGPTPLDLPGRPVPVPCPGHTSGHTAYLFADAGVVATGDALITAHPVSRTDGPQRVPDFFSHAPEPARTSLSALADLDADTIVPGHGPVWRGRLADAVAQAQQ
jgi:glyoxylase-like metal-dependent hydrolase (beta-lactamase superfamily II)